jgi:hypothetical protein
VATRSFIGKKQLSGGIEAVYCHWDGYPSGVGATLVKHWSDPAKLQSLLDLGDISYLGPKLGVKHDFDDRTSNDCTFYGRDRDEDGVESKFFASNEAFLEAASNHRCGYAYLFDLGLGNWRAFCGSNWSEFDLLEAIHEGK